MCRLCELFRPILGHAVDMDLQRYRELEAAGLPRPDADMGRDIRVGTDLKSGFLGCEPHGSLKARRIAGRKQLLRIGSCAARTAHLLRHRERSLEHAIVAADLALAPTPGGRHGRVQDLFGHRSFLLLMKSDLRPTRRRSTRSARARPQSEAA